MVSRELLVIEDDPSDVDLIREALKLPRERHYEINLSCVHGGEEAMSFLRKENGFQNAPKPDLIILDLNMSRKDGFEVLREIKGDEKFKSIPVVVLTTSSSMEDVQTSYRLGANTYITKAKDFYGFLKTIQIVEDYWFQAAQLPQLS